MSNAQTLTADHYSIFELETWDSRTRHEVVMQAAKAARSIDGAHVYQTDAYPLDMQSTGEDFGEMSTWISLHSPDGLDQFHRQVQAIRDAGTRVKYAVTYVPRHIATTSADKMWDWLSEEESKS